MKQSRWCLKLRCVNNKMLSVLTLCTIVCFFFLLDPTEVRTIHLQTCFVFNLKGGERELSGKDRSRMVLRCFVWTIVSSPFVASCEPKRHNVRMPRYITSSTARDDRCCECSLLTDNKSFVGVSVQAGNIQYSQRW